MNISNEIAEMLYSMLKETGRAEIRRNELAERIGCVPSQINYVIASRFTPELGYIVESRRGGGGYVKITRIEPRGEKSLMHIVNAIGEFIDEQSARAIIVNMVNSEQLTVEQGKLMLAAVNENAYRGIPSQYRQSFRAQMLKQLLLATR